MRVVDKGVEGRDGKRLDVREVVNCLVRKSWNFLGKFYFLEMFKERRKKEVRERECEKGIGVRK